MIRIALALILLASIALGDVKHAVKPGTYEQHLKELVGPNVKLVAIQGKASVTVMVVVRDRPNKFWEPNPILAQETSVLTNDHSRAALQDELESTIWRKAYENVVYNKITFFPIEKKPTKKE